MAPIFFPVCVLPLPHYFTPSLEKVRDVGWNNCGITCFTKRSYVVYGGLNENGPHGLISLVPSWWNGFGRTRRCGFIEGGRSLGALCTQMAGRHNGSCPQSDLSGFRLLWEQPLFVPAARWREGILHGPHQTQTCLLPQKALFSPGGQGGAQRWHSRVSVRS